MRTNENVFARENPLKNEGVDGKDPSGVLIEELMLAVMREAHEKGDDFTFTLGLDFVEPPAEENQPFSPLCGVVLKCVHTHKAYQGNYQVQCLTPHDIVTKEDFNDECDRLTREIEIIRRVGNKYFDEAKRRRTKPKVECSVIVAIKPQRERGET